MKCIRIVLTKNKMSAEFLVPCGGYRHMNIQFQLVSIENNFHEHVEVYIFGKQVACDI